MPQVNMPCPKIIQPTGYNLIPLNKQVDIKIPFSPLSGELSISLDNIWDIEQDYIDLFSYAKKGHMGKYVHMCRSHIYDHAITQDTYYPFKMECELIAQKAEQISRSVQDVEQALEIGPGSYSPVVLKTIPLLKTLESQPSFSTYKALDSNLEYAERACQIIQRQFANIRTEAIGIDFLSEKEFRKMKYDLESRGKKILFSFGQSIFASNNDEDISKFLKNIGILLRNGDYLLFCMDTNKDESMLEAAYNNKLVHDLLLNIMFYAKNKFNIRNFNPEAFKSIYKWSREERTVEHYLKPTMRQILKIRGNEFIINENNEFNILNSRKLGLNSIEKFLKKEKLIIKEVISLNEKNKFSIIIAQKIETIV